MAANILIAQSVGAGDLPMVKRIMGTATSFFFVLSPSRCAVLRMALAPALLRLMHTPLAASEEAIIYLRIMFAAMPFMYFFMFLQMAQRGAGDSRTPFYFMALAAVLDASLNPLLIRGIGPFPQAGHRRIGHLDPDRPGRVLHPAAASTSIASSSVLMLRPSELRLLKPDLNIIRPLIAAGHSDGHADVPHVQRRGGHVRLRQQLTAP